MLTARSDVSGGASDFEVEPDGHDGAQDERRFHLLTELLHHGWAVPLVVLVHLVQESWVNVPHSDQWSFALDMREWDGAPGFSELASFHNEHRLLFPRLLMVVLARLTDWDTRFEMAASVILAVVIFLALKRLLGTTLCLDRLNTGIASAATALLVFSPLQWENWLWGWQVQWYLSVAALVTSLLVLHSWPAGRAPWEAVVVASGAAVVGQYSLASGTFIWGSALVVLLAQRRYWKFVPAWVVVAGVSTALYLNGYTRPRGHPPLADLGDLDALLVYLSTYVGRSVTTHGWADVAGLLVAATGVVVVHRLVAVRASLPRCAPWVGILLFASCSAAATALGRTGFGVDQSGSSRYTTISSLLTLSVCALASIAINEGGRQPGKVTARRQIAAGSTPFVLVAVLLIGAAPSAIEQMRAEGGQRARARACVARADVESDPCLDELPPFSASEIFVATEFLRSRGWGPSADGS